MQALWMLAATLMFAFMGTGVKLASEMGASLAQIAFMRGLPSVVMLLIWARSARLSLIPPAWTPHLRRNGAGVTSMWLGFYAISHLPLATAITLNYTTPLFIAGWMIGWGGAGRDRVRVLSVVLGFVGVLAVLRPTINPAEWLAAVLGVAAAGCGAVAQMQLRAMGQSGEPAWRTVFYFSLSVTLSGLVAMLFEGPRMPTPGGWAALMGIGVSGLLGQLAVTRAFGLGSPLLSAALQYTIIIFASGLGFLIWGDTPDRVAIIGMATIVAASLLSVWRTANTARRS